MPVMQSSRGVMRWDSYTWPARLGSRCDPLLPAAGTMAEGGAQGRGSEGFGLGVAGLADGCSHGWGSHMHGGGGRREGVTAVYSVRGIEHCRQCGNV